MLFYPDNAGSEGRLGVEWIAYNPSYYYYCNPLFLILLLVLTFSLKGAGLVFYYPTTAKAVVDVYYYYYYFYADCMNCCYLVSKLSSICLSKIFPLDHIP